MEDACFNMEVSIEEKSVAPCLEKERKPRKSREHTQEERKKHQKRWRERKKAKGQMLKQDQVPSPEPLALALTRPESEIPAVKRKEEKKERKACSRGQQLVALALGKKEPDDGPQPSSSHQAKKAVRDEGTLKRQLVKAASAACHVERASKIQKVIAVQQQVQCPATEIADPDLIVFSQPKAEIGSGTFGRCFRATYREIPVIVKEMKGDDKRAKKETLHEAKVIYSLGAHKGLPLLLGVMTKKAPYSLVLKYHSVQSKSVTLHQAASTKMLTKSSVMEIFRDICRTLQHIHDRGYLHNDIKANNVVLEGQNGTLFPILIDFGKSRKICKCKDGSAICQVRKADYLAPEVREFGHETTASDVYSVGRMLKSTSVLLEFYQYFRPLIKLSTLQNAKDRPTLAKFIDKLLKLSDVDIYSTNPS